MKDFYQLADSGFNIIWLVISVAIWLFTSYQKRKKAKMKKEVLQKAPRQAQESYNSRPKNNRHVDDDKFFGILHAFTEEVNGNQKQRKVVNTVFEDDMEDKRFDEYEIKKRKPSKAKKMFDTKGELKQAIIAAEVLKRPYQ